MCTMNIIEAVEKGALAQVRSFLNDDISLVKSTRNDSGSTLLHIAAEDGYREIIKLLLSKGIDINVRDEAGNTPLHKAVLNGELESVRLLLSRGADINARDDQGVTPLDYAGVAGVTGMIDFLRSKGAIAGAKVPDLKYTPPIAFGRISREHAEAHRGEVISKTPEIYVFADSNFHCLTFVSYHLHRDRAGDYYIIASLYVLKDSPVKHAVPAQPQYIIVKLTSPVNKQYNPGLAVLSSAASNPPDRFALEDKVKHFKYADDRFVLDKDEENGGYGIAKELLLLLERAGSTFNDWNVEDSMKNQEVNHPNSWNPGFIISESRREMVNGENLHRDGCYVFRSNSFDWRIAMDLSQAWVISRHHVN